MPTKPFPPKLSGYCMRSRGKRKSWMILLPSRSTKTIPCEFLIATVPSTGETAKSRGRPKKSRRVPSGVRRCPVGTSVGPTWVGSPPFGALASNMAQTPHTAIERIATRTDPDRRVITKSIVFNSTPRVHCQLRVVVSFAVLLRLDTSRRNQSADGTKPTKPDSFVLTLLDGLRCRDREDFYRRKAGDGVVHFVCDRMPVDGVLVVLRVAQQDDVTAIGE